MGGKSTSAGAEVKRTSSPNYNILSTGLECSSATLPRRTLFRFQELQQGLVEQIWDLQVRNVADVREQDQLGARNLAGDVARVLGKILPVAFAADNKRLRLYMCPVVDHWVEIRNLLVSSTDHRETGPIPA